MNGSRLLAAVAMGNGVDEVYIMYYLMYLYTSEIADNEQYVIVYILFFIFSSPYYFVYHPSICYIGIHAILFNII